MGRGRWPALLAALLTLTGCAGGEGDPSARPADNPAAVYEASAGDGGEMSDLSAAEELASPRSVTEEEEVLSAYERAVEAYGWFELEPLPSVGEPLQIDGAAYRLVDAPGIAKLEDLRTYLRSIFSAELTEELLATGVYREADGALYVSLPGRPRAADKGGAQIQVNPSGSGGCRVDVNVDLLNEDGSVVGLECWSFPYDYVDGRWVFTDFSLIY